MEPFCTEHEMVELLMRIYGSSALAPDVTTDACYLFAQMQDFSYSVISRATYDLWHRNLTKKMAICGIEEMCGFAGFTAWRDRLLRIKGLRTLPKEAILPIPVPPETKTANTHLEATWLVNFAKRQEWGSVYVIASPLHQLRAFIETVNQILRQYPKLRVYSMPGHSMPWSVKEFMFSQGKIGGKPCDLITSELKKTKACFKKGDLASGREILDYLNGREETDEKILAYQQFE